MRLLTLLVISASAISLTALHPAFAALPIYSVEFHPSVHISGDQREQIKMGIQKRFISVQNMDHGVQKLVFSDKLPPGTERTQPVKIFKTMTWLMSANPKDKELAGYVEELGKSFRDAGENGPELNDMLKTAALVETELNPIVFNAHPDFLEWMIDNDIGRQSVAFHHKWVKGHGDTPILVMPNGRTNWIMLKRQGIVDQAGHFAPGYGYTAQGFVPVGAPVAKEPAQKGDDLFLRGDEVNLQGNIEAAGNQLETRENQESSNGQLEQYQGQNLELGHGHKGQNPAELGNGQDNNGQNLELGHGHEGQNQLGNGQDNNGQNLELGHGQEGQNQLGNGQENNGQVQEQGQSSNQLGTGHENYDQIQEPQQKTQGELDNSSNSSGLVPVKGHGHDTHGVNNQDHLKLFETARVFHNPTAVMTTFSIEGPATCEPLFENDGVLGAGCSLVPKDSQAVVFHDTAAMPMLVAKSTSSLVGRLAGRTDKSCQDAYMADGTVLDYCELVPILGLPSGREGQNGGTLELPSGHEHQQQLDSGSGSGLVPRQ